MVDRFQGRYFCDGIIDGCFDELSWWAEFTDLKSWIFTYVFPVCAVVYGDTFVELSCIGGKFPDRYHTDTGT